MIEHLAGELIEKTPTKAVIAAGGVGYGASITFSCYEALPAVGQQASMAVHLVVREDSLTLYGFADVAEREMFLLLTSVSGIGPKIAVGILSSIGTDTLSENIARGNSAALTMLPGIGKKTAERITLELRDKIGAHPAGAVSTAPGGKADIRSDALDALLALGYSRNNAERAIRGALKGGPETERNVETLIKAALKHATE